MIFLSVNHNLLYTILWTYPPGPFRNNQNSPKKIFIFPAFPATLFQRGNFQHAKFFQRGKFAGKANCKPNTLKDWPYLINTKSQNCFSILFYLILGPDQGIQ